MLRLAAHAMRTRFEIVLADTTRDAPALRAAGEAALAEVASVETSLSRYQQGSEIFRLNQAAGEAVRIGPRLIALLDTVRRLSEQTGGAFDPTVTPLIDLWQSDEVPTPEAVEQARERVGIAGALHLDANAYTARLRSGSQLDPGAWGKGYALDLAAETLREAGIRNALLHGGTSTVIALGAPPDNASGWPVAIQHPLRPETHLATVRLRDAALSVSAVHGRTFYARDRNGNPHRWGHVIDPRTGYPVASTLLAAVVTPYDAERGSGLISDALSTALLVAGRDAGESVSAAFPDIEWLVAQVHADHSLHSAQRGIVWQEVKP